MSENESEEKRQSDPTEEAPVAEAEAGANVESPETGEEAPSHTNEELEEQALSSEETSGEERETDQESESRSQNAEPEAAVQNASQEQTSLQEQGEREAEEQRTQEEQESEGPGNQNPEPEPTAQTLGDKEWEEWWAGIQERLEQEEQRQAMSAGNETDVREEQAEADIEGQAPDEEIPWYTDEELEQLALLHEQSGLEERETEQGAGSRNQNPETGQEQEAGQSQDASQEQASFQEQRERERKEEQTRGEEQSPDDRQDADPMSASREKHERLRNRNVKGRGDDNNIVYKLGVVADLSGLYVVPMPQEKTGKTPLEKAKEKLMDKLPVKRSPTQEKEKTRNKNRDRDRDRDR